MAIEAKKAVDQVPATLAHPRVWEFWIAVVLTGLGTGIGAVVLSLILDAIQHALWPGSSNADLLDAVTRASAWHRVLALTAAGVVTAIGQFILRRLSSGNGIEITAAIWFAAGRLPALRTLGSALLSIVIVGMGASLGREGAPKQVGAVVANLLATPTKLSDEQRRLLVACGAGAGMAAAYGVPLGGALFALEVLRGALALRLVLPALVTSLIATGVSWSTLPSVPTYAIPAFETSASVWVWSLLAGGVMGVASVAFVRVIAWADRNRPTGRARLIAPILAFALLGLASIAYPQLLGNGKDIAQLAFTGALPSSLLLALMVLKPASTVLCFGSGAPGGLFTPSLSSGALLGGALGQAWLLVWPGGSPGLFAMLGAVAMLAATTQGPISAIVLMIELTGRDLSSILPILIAVVSATIVARSIELRSIYEARLSDEQVRKRLEEREPASS
jgi:chloride channel protein, CIC family